jgi:hypothetical protein
MRTTDLASATSSIWWRSAPVIVLLVSSPVIGKVLFDATRITTLFVRLPQIGTWGCAAWLAPHAPPQVAATELLTPPRF